MLEKFKEFTLDELFGTLHSQVYDKLSADQYRCDDLVFTSNFFGIFSSPISLVARIAFAALAQCTNLAYVQTNWDMPSKSAIRPAVLRPGDGYDDGATYIKILRTIPTAFTCRATYDAIGQAEGETYINLNKALINATNKTILGIATFAKKKDITIAVNTNNEMTPVIQVFFTVLAYKALNLKKAGKHEIKLFNNLNDAFSKHLKDIENDTLKTTIKECLIEYMEGTGLFKHDLLSEAKNAIQELKKRKLENIENEMNEVYRRLEQNKSRMLDLTTRLETLKEDYNKYNSDVSKLDKEYEELIEILDRYKYIEHYKIENNSIKFIVRQPMYINDIDQWLRISNRACGNVNLSRLLNKTFTEEYQIYTAAAIRVDLMHNNVSRACSMREHPEIDHHTPHPHIENFSCFGQHESVIRDDLLEGRLVDAVEQSIAATSELNAFDGAVVNRFITALLTSDYQTPCFRDRDGKWFSLKDFEERNEE